MIDKPHVRQNKCADCGKQFRYDSRAKRCGRCARLWNQARGLEDGWTRLRKQLKDEAKQ
jgi:hypothetical protein